MIVFRTFLKILNKKKATLVLYTGIMMAILLLNFSSGSSKGEFVSKKPSVMVINHDQDTVLAQHFVSYLEKNAVIKNYDNIEDALFYQQVSYVIEIPAGFHQQIMNHQKPVLNITAAANREAGLSKIILDSYLRMAGLFASVYDQPQQVAQSLNATLMTKVDTTMFNGKLSSGLDKAVMYFNFANYTVIMCCILVVTTVMMAFKKTEVFKRTMVSSLKFMRYQRLLTLSNGVYALLLWVLYVVLAVVFVGSTMWSWHGLLYSLNLLWLVICMLVLALLISNLITNENAVDGVVNVVGLGSSFLCGAFVPMRFLPEQVLLFARILPSYWYVKTNELLYELKLFEVEFLKPIFINMAVLIGFTVLFLVLNYWVSNKKRVLS